MGGVQFLKQKPLSNGSYFILAINENTLYYGQTGFCSIVAFHCNIVYSEASVNDFESSKVAAMNTMGQSPLQLGNYCNFLENVFASNFDDI